MNGSIKSGEDLTHQDTAYHRDLQRRGYYSKQDRLQNERYAPSQYARQYASLVWKAGVVYLVPRSIARVRPPVCRARWKRMSRFSRCSKVSRATFLIACWPIPANTAFKSSPNKLAPIRAAPSSSGGQYLRAFVTEPRPTACNEGTCYNPDCSVRCYFDIKCVDYMFENNGYLYIEDLVGT